MRGRWLRRAMPAAMAAAFVALAAPVPAYGAGSTAGCPSGGRYPVGAGAVLEVSATHPSVGAAVELAGSGFCRAERLRITVNGRDLTDVVTDADGAFAAVRLAAPAPGRAPVCAIRSATGRDRVCVTLEALPAHSRAATGAGARSAITGARVAALVALSALLLASGLALATAGRRRAVSGSG